MAFLLSFFHPAVRNLGVMAGALAAVLGHKGEGHGVGRLKGAWNTVNFAGTTPALEYPLCLLCKRIKYCVFKPPPIDYFCFVLFSGT